MSDEYVVEPSDCDHDNMEYRHRDAGEPDVMYENWHCTDCGAAVVLVYELQRRIIDPIDGDCYVEEVGSQCRMT